MSNFWWKIIALQILIATEICTTGLELDDKPKLTSENLHMLLIKKFLEEMNSPHAIEESNIDTIEIVENIAQENDEKFTNGYKNVPILTFGAPKNPNNNESIGQKRNHYVTTLCHFKICNKKRSINEYDNFIRYLTKNMNPQQF